MIVTLEAFLVIHWLIGTKFADLSQILLIFKAYISNNKLLRRPFVSLNVVERKVDENRKI